MLEVASQSAHLQEGRNTREDLSLSVPLQSMCECLWMGGLKPISHVKILKLLMKL